MNDRKLKRCVFRTGKGFEFLGNWIGHTHSILAKSFDVIIDSPYFSDVGMYIKCCLEEVTKEELDRVLHFRTQRKREIWVWRFREDNPTDKGRALVYRIEGEEVIQHPKNWPISKVVSSEKIKGKAGKRA